MYAEKANDRLQKADHRFFLKATTNKQGVNRFFTRFSVENRYDFEPFHKGDKFTDLPLAPDMVLLMPDGLSEYMDSGLKIAKPFDYSATWGEIWT